MKYLLLVFILGVSIISCKEDPIIMDPTNNSNYPAVKNTFNGSIDLNNLFDYANQDIPMYINRDNTDGNSITNEQATLGRVLFYDKSLSTDNTISCASCHKQELAFSDDKLKSVGVNGETGRHSMRLVNARFSAERRFFWDERAATLEAQTTQPIQDHAEMGFSGQNGDPNINDLINKLENLDYYQELFTFVYGDPTITENRIQLALAQFIRSIQSFDSKYDAGTTSVNNLNQPFPNFTPSENRGKMLYTAPPINGPQGRIDGGFGCQGCHSAPEFSINPNSSNNGVITDLNSSILDITVTRSPTLRDLFDSNGNLISPLMHNGAFQTIEDVLDHYNNVEPDIQNTNLDNRLANNGQGQHLNMTTQERDDLIAFLKTLSGQNVYTNEKWSNPF